MFVTPALVFYIIFVVYPLFGGIIYSLTSWDGITSKIKFVGFKNYVELFQDEFVLLPLRNTIIFAFLSMVLLNVLGLLMAIGVENVKGKSFYRGLLYIPAVLGSLVVGYIFSFIISEPLSDFGAWIGNATIQNNLLGSKQYALYMGTIVAVWKNAGWYMVVYIAGLQTIDQSLYDAAIIDGATVWKKFRYVTFPLIAPAFTINMILSVERAFKEYDLMFALTGGGPGRSSELVSMTIYNESFTNKRAGYGSALGVILFLLIVIVTMCQLYVLRRRENDINY
jgi:raffinose/stachyose/melibiose transport system permease protein